MRAVLAASDLFLAPSLSDAEAQAYLAPFGFRDPAAADHHLQSMADDLAVRQAMAAVAAPLLAALAASPDPDAALVAFSRYLAARSARISFLEYLAEDERALPVLAQILGASPVLSELLIRNPESFHWLRARLDRHLDLADDAVEIDRVLAHVDDPSGQLDALKRFKRRELLWIAVRDLLDPESLEAITGALSDLADLIINHALGITTRQLLHAAGRAALPGTFAVIGMGKLGGRELNYSSDIDLIYVYEPASLDDPQSHELFQRLGRRLTAALTEYTSESYLYRVDLRLRPMGRSGSVAYSLDQYRLYYESWGETFERFALIKARHVAGDPELGRRFVEVAREYVYRKYLDYAAIEEMARHKARMDREVRQRGETERNIKLGRGGIREVEVFTQVLQLLYGADRAELQDPNTLDALAALQRAGLVSESVVEALQRAYVFLRMLEHRLQIVHESQTHSLARAADELEICARRLGFADAPALEAALEAHRTRVHEMYLELFAPRDGTRSFESRLLYQLLAGELTDEEAEAFLARVGIRQPALALRALLALDQAPSVAHARSASRNLLANLLAVWLPRLAQAAEPEQVLNRLEQVTTGTGAASALYRALLENEALRERLTVVLDAGTLLAQRLIRYPELLDFLLVGPTDGTVLRRRLDRGFEEAEGLTPVERLARVRRIKQVEEFKAILGWLGGGRLRTLQRQLSLVAECSVRWAARWHAPPSAAPWAIVALGKLGGAELTAHSDVDLVFIYEGDPADSDEFIRQDAFVRAIRSFLEEPTSEGVAYRIDPRLRPEGSKGALAMPFPRFESYLRERAEPWERLAWTRARVLIAAPRLAAGIRQAVTRFVYGGWDPQIPGYVRRVRARMERELAGSDDTRLDFKVGPGGLADIDFLLQVIQIREGHTRPEFRISGTPRLLARLPATRYFVAAEAPRLRAAYRFLRVLELLARMEADSAVNWIAADPSHVEPLGRRLGLSDPAGEQILARYAEVTTYVRTLYRTVLDRLEGS